MLPAGNRLRRSADFDVAVRRGRRVGRGTLVVHLLVQQDVGSTPPGPRVGFVVSRAIGNAVTRNRVTRRLRALCADRLTGLPAGSSLVVRALPPAAGATTARLAADLDVGLDRALRAGPREGT